MNEIICICGHACFVHAFSLVTMNVTLDVWYCTFFSVSPTFVCMVMWPTFFHSSPVVSSGTHWLLMTLCLRPLGLLCPYLINKREGLSKRRVNLFLSRITEKALRCRQKAQQRLSRPKRAEASKVKRETWTKTGHSSCSPRPSAAN